MASPATSGLLGRVALANLSNNPDVAGDAIMAYKVESWSDSHLMITPPSKVSWHNARESAESGGTIV